MTRKILIIIGILTYLIIFCASVPKHMQNANYCYNNEDTGIDSLININGYYLILYSDTGLLKGSDSYIFYQNGLFKMNLPAKYDSVKKQYDISLGLQEVVENIDKEYNKWFYLGMWGSYIICGDTIKVQYINKPWLFSSAYGREEWFKIIDRNTLIPINSRPLNPDKSYWQNYEYYKSINDEKAKHSAIFEAVSIKPSPEEAWILKEKWFWCDEQDWKDYIKEARQKKKKK